MKDEDRADALNTTKPTPDLLLPGVPAAVDRLSAIRRRLAEWATAAGLPRDQVQDLTLATYEAMSNVIDHAYPHSSGMFDLHAEHQVDRLTVTIVDHGRWKPADVPTTGLRGRGLLLMKGLSSEFELIHQSVGTLVRMSWPLPTR